MKDKEMIYSEWTEIGNETRADEDITDDIFQGLIEHENVLLPTNFLITKTRC